MKELCPICGFWYSVSKPRDTSKVFVCADCCGMALARISKKKYTPIYNRYNMAIVRGGANESPLL